MAKVKTGYFESGLEATFRRQHREAHLKLQGEALLSKEESDKCPICGLTENFN